MGIRSSKQQSIPEVAPTPIADAFKEFPCDVAPKDEEGYVQSFNLDQKDDYLTFFRRYGFVVVNDVLSREQIEASLEEIWTYLETTQFGWETKDMVKRDDPKTWEDTHWPPAIKKLGILGNGPAIGQQAWENRQNENLYQVYCHILGRKDLWSSIDRWGVMRPTVKIPHEPVRSWNDLSTEGETSDRPKWKTAEGWLHWDMNPCKENGDVTDGTGKWWLGREMLIPSNNFL
eukprot:TRINITY_DN7798_c0_g1_i2.p1 TRINITY_DN7798_c0_g1~~TRINITY_DN7798_c0_g1_i2.p1  ORF type:complete len:231 (-),score=21.73 TRINITY_DN7798_c0_g1_i2:443-1135(-)